METAATEAVKRERRKLTEEIMENEATRSSAQIARTARRERGTGGIFRLKYRDRKTLKMRKGRCWWIQYRDNSQRPVRENTHSDKINVAKQLLQRRLGEVQAGLWVRPSVQKTSITDMMEELFRDYRINDLKSVTLAEHRWRKHIEPFFGKMRAIEVTTDALNLYIDKRKAGGAENGTINRELALVRRAFHIAFHSTPRKVHEIPSFTMLKENDPRSGFITYEQYAQLCRCCEESWFRAMIAAAYNFGFRVNELRTLRVSQVDLLSRTITLAPGNTKNGKGRTVPMTNEVYTLLCSCVMGKNADEFVFTRKNGKPISDYRWDWSRICVRAGLGKLSCPRCAAPAESEEARHCKKCHALLRYSGKIFHDFRRSAVRNMTRSGVPRSDAMKISGHRTESVFERYNIGNDADLAVSARRIEEHQKQALSSHQTRTNDSQPLPTLAN